ncbi:MAG: GIY-YIG nuclease family protein [Candidatus Peregrinibacteria bacterium]
MKYWVYVLRSEKTGYRYIGQTNNLPKRLMEHRKGLTRSIRFQLPFALTYFECYKSRCEAMKRERFLKSGKGREWLQKTVGV